MSKSNVPTGKQHSGGGRTPVQVGQRLGPTSATKVDPRNVAAIGAKRGDHSEYGTARNHQQVPPREMGKMPQPVLGNAKALDVGRGGPGAGRILHGQSGSQGQHGPTNPGSGDLPRTPGGGPGGFGFSGKGDRQ
jgi:hypothetical protein